MSDDDMMWMYLNKIHLNIIYICTPYDKHMLISIHPVIKSKVIVV